MQPSHTLVGSQNDPLWYKDAIIYEAHVRAFYDSNADGMGDFRGLAEKLDSDSLSGKLVVLFDSSLGFE